MDDIEVAFEANFVLPMVALVGKSESDSAGAVAVTKKRHKKELKLFFSNDQNVEDSQNHLTVAVEIIIVNFTQRN